MIGMMLLGLDLGSPAVIFAVMLGSLAGIAPTLNVAVRPYFGSTRYAPVAGLFGQFRMLSVFSGAGAGWLRDHLGSYQHVFGALGALTAISLSAALFLLFRPVRHGSD